PDRERASWRTPSTTRTRAPKQSHATALGQARGVLRKGARPTGTGPVQSPKLHRSSSVLSVLVAHRHGCAVRCLHPVWTAHGERVTVLTFDDRVDGVPGPASGGREGPT